MASGPYPSLPTCDELMEHMIKESPHLSTVEGRWDINIESLWFV